MPQCDVAPSDCDTLPQRHLDPCYELRYYGAMTKHSTPFPGLPDGFNRRVEQRGPEDCWPMTPAHGAGYAQYGRGARTHGDRMAHRIAWRWAHDWQEIPEGYEIHHDCKTRNCVNPAHLECITLAENRALSDRSSTTLDEPRSRSNPRPRPEGLCKRDHEDPWWLNAQGYWICRECASEASKRPRYLEGSRQRIEDLSKRSSSEILARAISSQ